MLDTLPENFTRLLKDAARRDPKAAAAALSAAYESLRGTARRILSHERQDHTLTPTALVHEAYARMFPAMPESASQAIPNKTSLMGGDPAWKDRRHFLASAAEVMKCLLIDYARAAGRQKRGGGRRRVSFESAGIDELIVRGDPDEILAVTDAVERLGKAHPVPGQVVQMRFFAGLTSEATADAMGISVEMVKRKWAFARAYLADLLRDEETTP